MNGTDGKTTLKQVAREDVKLKKPHTHGGVDYAIGDSIAVTAKQKKRLADSGII